MNADAAATEDLASDQENLQNVNRLYKFVEPAAIQFLLRSDACRGVEATFTTS